MSEVTGMNIQLSDEEFIRIQRYRAQLGAIRGQIDSLMVKGDEVADVLNTSFRDANRRVQLEDKEFVERLGGEPIPPLVNAIGMEIVTINTKTREATWKTVHDAKRIAKEPDSKETETEGLASGTMEEQLLEKIEELEQAKEAESDCDDKGDETVKEEE